MHRAHQDNYYSNQYILGDKEEKWVRKLTPIEAFRLQGFPDKFTINAYNVGLSDAQLYMQAGNSVTINVVEAVLKKLIEDIGKKRPHRSFWNYIFNRPFCTTGNKSCSY